MIKIITIALFFFTNLLAADLKLDEIFRGLNKPWSLTFIDNSEILITEKSGKIKYINLKNKTRKTPNHNLKILEDGQGGLLDILYKNNYVYVSYSEDRLNSKSSTSVKKI